MNQLKVVLSFVIMLGFVVAMDGCKSKQHKERRLTRKGVIESVDVANGIITMSTYVEKTGKDQTIPGRVDNETEIYIEGKIAKLSDIKPHDNVVAEGYERNGDIIARKLTIIRRGEPTERIIKSPASQSVQ